VSSIRSMARFAAWRRRSAWTTTPTCRRVPRPAWARTRTPCSRSSATRRARSGRCASRRRWHRNPRPDVMTLLAPQPRYRQLAQTLINEIESGRYPVGDLLPTEFELCEQFGASRFTVREAIKQLVQLGLVARQPGVGTRVKIAQPASEYRQVMQRLADLQQDSAQAPPQVFHAKPIS